MPVGEGLFVDVGFPRNKLPVPRIPKDLVVTWTQMLIPDRFREFVECRYNISARIPIVISWDKKRKEDEDWINWFADTAGLNRPMHFFHNDKSLNPVVKKKTTKKRRNNGTRI